MLAATYAPFSGRGCGVGTSLSMPGETIAVKKEPLFQ